jgi:hypothetical protein
MRRRERRQLGGFSGNDVVIEVEAAGPPALPALAGNLKWLAIGGRRPIASHLSLYRRVRDWQLNSECRALIDLAFQLN